MKRPTTYRLTVAKEAAWQSNILERLFLTAGHIHRQLIWQGPISVGLHDMSLKTCQNEFSRIHV